MGEYLGFVDGLLARLHGPMAFRFVLQPLMASLLAIRDGRRDAREGRPPFALALLTGAGGRRSLRLDAWRSIGSVMIVAALVDFLFQLMVFGGPRPGAGLMAAVILAALPYDLLRGPVNRLLSRRRLSARQPAGAVQCTGDLTLSDLASAEPASAVARCQRYDVLNPMASSAP